LCLIQQLLIARGQIENNPFSNENSPGKPLVRGRPMEAIIIQIKKTGEMQVVALSSLLNQKFLFHLSY
jgi:hypothetical protein